MSSYIMPDDAPKAHVKGNRLILGIGGAFAVTISLLLAATGLWLITASHCRYSDWLSSGSAVIIADTGIALFYGIPLLLLCLITLGIYGIFMAVTGFRNSWVDRTLVKPISLGIVIGAIFMFSGKYIGNTFWSAKFEESGYVRCDDSFALTSKWSATVWALTPSICMDPTLKDTLRYSDSSIYHINENYSPSENL